MPYSYSTGGFESTSESNDNVDPVLNSELEPSLRFEIPDLIDAVFGHIPHLEELARTAFKSCQEGDNIRYTKDAGWTEWPKSCGDTKVIDWLGSIMPHLTKSIQNEEGYVAHPRRMYSTPNLFIVGSPIKRKLDTGIERIDGSSQHDPPLWDRILVVGELKSQVKENKQRPVFLGLAEYAREVFRTQDRRFVLGFTLCGPVLRLWHFDRSGSSGSESFSINDDGYKFVRVMLGYFIMNDEQLGFDPTIHREDGKRWIEITREGKIERLFIEGKIRTHAAIIGRATSCWHASTGKGKRLVIKDSWQYEERAEEGELLQLAKSLPNVAEYYHHETVQCSDKDDDTLGNVRRGMMKGCSRRGRQRGPSTQPAASMSREKTTSNQSQAGGKPRKRGSSSPRPMPPSKRSRTSHSESRTDPAQHNRIHRRIITSSPGKPLNEASSPLSIVNAFIGAISGKYSYYHRRGYPVDFLGHESLLGRGILHRDISIGNIMLKEAEDDGFLIDLDLAIKITDQQPSGAPNRTGTKAFMAIGALLGDQHSFMHDLESFFWVFFWICVHYEGLGKDGKMAERKRGEFESWNYDEPEKLAAEKAGRIFLDLFERMDEKVTKYCKSLLPCLSRLHGVVFPGSRPVRKNYKNPGLYAEMIQVLKDAKSDIAKATVQ